MTDHTTNSTGPISKKQLLAEMQSEQAAWLALLDEIGEEHMTQPEAASGWSIKDIVQRHNRRHSHPRVPERSFVAKMISYCLLLA